jgi:hypothetical protein
MVHVPKRSASSHDCTLGAIHSSSVRTCTHYSLFAPSILSRCLQRGPRARSTVGRWRAHSPVQVERVHGRRAPRCERIECSSAPVECLVHVWVRRRGVDERDEVLICGRDEPGVDPVADELPEGAVVPQNVEHDDRYDIRH